MNLVGLMKVKVSELKTNLSRYLKHLDEAGTIEVCLREEPVAYLVSARSPSERTQQVLADKVSEAGLVLRSSSSRRPTGAIPTPGVAGDGRTDISTVESMRQLRNY